MIHRLNVRATEQLPRLYLGHHLATATHEREGEFDITATSNGLRILCEGKGTEVYVEYKDLISSVLEVV